MARPSRNPMQQEAMKIVQTNIIQFMNRNGMTQVELSEKTGIPPTTINGYVKGTSLPTPGNVEKLSKVFNIPKESIDPRFKSEVFNEFDIASYKGKLNYEEGQFFEQLIEKTLSLTESERKDFLKNVRFAIKFFEKDRESH